MKIFHLSDLHIGKRVNEFSLIEDQRYFLTLFLEMVATHNPSIIVIAGDVYDKSVPSTEAVEIFDDFLTAIHQRNIPIFIISGNHDSPERLGFGSRIMESKGVFLSGSFQGTLPKTKIKEQGLEVNIFSLPFIKPSTVRRYFPDASIETYQDVVKTVIENAQISSEEINVLIAHQFVTGGGALPKRYESETITIGGQDNVDVSLFQPFDYVALGHLHGPQSVGRETVRYCGSPLKYSFSEKNNQKTVTVVHIENKDSIALEFLPIRPLREMREIRGPLEKLISEEVVSLAPRDDYLRVILTDENEIIDAIGRLRAVYPNIMNLSFENSRTNGNRVAEALENVTKKNNLELFVEFYEKQQNRELDKEKLAIIREALEKIGGQA